MRTHGSQSGKAACALLMVVWLCVLLMGSVAQRHDPGTTPASGGDLRERYLAGLNAFRAGDVKYALSECEFVALNASGYLRLCATNMVGQLHRVQGQATEAGKAFASVAEQAGLLNESRDVRDSLAGNALVLERLALHYQAEIAHEQREWTTAIAFYERLLAMRDGRRPEAFKHLGASPALMEKLGRLYWRTQQHERAIRTFKQSLERWPDQTRAPALKLAIISLENHAEGTPESKYAFLLCETTPRELNTTRVSIAPSTTQTLAPLPEAPNPNREAIDQLLKELREDNAWRPVLLNEKGWMLAEEGKYAEARTIFSEVAAWPSPSRVSPWTATMTQYAELSKSIILLREGKHAESMQHVEMVMGSNPQGHIQDLAASLSASIARRQQAAKMGAKCSVQKLK